MTSWYDIESLENRTAEKAAGLEDSRVILVRPLGCVICVIGFTLERISTIWIHNVAGVEAEPCVSSNTMPLGSVPFIVASNPIQLVCAWFGHIGSFYTISTQLQQA
jgi:hypothetical protein